jgi:hypothetical protein
MLLGRFDGSPQEWLVIAIGGAVAYLVHRRSIRDRRIGVSAGGWNTVEGEVYSTASTGLGRGDYAVTVNYGYHQGEYQSGEFIVPFSSPKESKKFEERMKNHAKIIVRYDPADPSRSAILLSDNDS